ncbi:MAG: helix-turn-helix transcriptional regulator [Polyangia bacterium]
MSTVKIDGRHILAARDLLKMTQEDLAEAAGVSRLSVFNAENGKTVTRSTTLDKIREALERRGIEFMNGDSPGVRLHPSKAIIPV